MLRTRPDVASTALAGSSLGRAGHRLRGLKHPEVYGLLGEVSPSTWWNNDVIVTDVRGRWPRRRGRSSSTWTRGRATSTTRRTPTCWPRPTSALGYVDGTSFRHVVQPGAAHSEMYWAERFPGAMQLLLGVR